MQQRGWPCLAQQQDIRALAAFRILSGLYLLYDIIERLQYGRLSLLWYTSTDNSFLRPDDTPHRSPIHRFWFYRGSENVQIFLFVVTFLLSLSFMLGYKCNAFSKTLLWLNVVAMQCRCMPPHDGSDTFIRHLLLWSIQLPMSQVWSLDSVYQQNMLKKRTDKRNIDYCDIQNVVAVWGLRLQIVIMYLGTVIHRTYDSYGFEIYKSKWLPPQLTAVHYALHQSLGSRDSWLCNFVRNNLPASQFMTLTGMLIETFAPIMSLIMGNKAHIPAFFLFKLHFGLYVLMNLPNWQFVGMIASVVWLPSWFWNNMQKNLALRFPNVFAPPTVYLSPELMEKKDGVSEAERKKNSVRDATIKAQRRRRPFMTYFLFACVLYDSVGNREWFRKFDNGNIIEGIGFSRYWVMFSEPSSNT
uniref:HTTM-like domain-containing protein n=1 Tax=Ditylum brightwellii TaxID=49249 RepID=A0A7S4QSG5_9STRA